MHVNYVFLEDKSPVRVLTGLREWTALWEETAVIIDNASVHKAKASKQLMNVLKKI
jgi:hypothetical protein